MGDFHLIIVIMVVGLVLYLVNRFVPMDKKINIILNWVVIIVVILWILKVLGIIADVHDVKI